METRGGAGNLGGPGAPEGRAGLGGPGLGMCWKGRGAPEGRCRQA